MSMQLEKYMPPDQARGHALSRCFAASSLDDDHLEIGRWRDHRSVGRTVEAGDEGGDVARERSLSRRVERLESLEQRPVLCAENLDPMLGRPLTEGKLGPGSPQGGRLQPSGGWDVP